MRSHDPGAEPGASTPSPEPEGGQPQAEDAQRSDFDAAPAPPGELNIDPFLRDLLEGRKPETDDEQQLAERVADRHGLPMNLAAKVATKAISLQAAQLIKPAAQKQETSQTVAQPGRVGARRVVVALALLAVMAVGFQVPRARAAHDEQRQAAVAGDVRKAVAATTVTRDALHRTVEVVGHDARSVLIAFCAASAPPGEREPLYVAATTPPQAGVKLGLFRDGQDPGTLHAITIERQSRARRWVAGTGNEPIVARVQSAVPPGTPTVAVRLGAE